MLPCVVISYVDHGFCGREISEEEDTVLLEPSSVMKRNVWLKLRGHRRKSVPIYINDPYAACRFGQLYLNMQTQSVCSAFCSDVECALLKVGWEKRSRWNHS